MLGNIIWICPLAPGTSADVLIWDGYGPSRTRGDFFDFEVGGHDGAYKDRIHVIVPFIGRKNGTLTARQQCYKHWSHKCGCQYIQYNSAPYTHHKLRRWSASGNTTHTHLPHPLPHLACHNQANSCSMRAQYHPCTSCLLSTIQMTVGVAEFIDIALFCNVLLQGRCAVHHGLFGGPSPSEGKSRAEVGIVNTKVARRARAGQTFPQRPILQEGGGICGDAPFSLWEILGFNFVLKHLDATRIFQAEAMKAY